MSSKNKVDAYIQISRLLDQGEDRLANQLLTAFVSQTVSDVRKNKYYASKVSIPICVKKVQSKANKLTKQYS